MLDANDFYAANKETYKNDLTDFNLFKDSYKQDIVATVKVRDAFKNDLYDDQKSHNTQHLGQDHRNLALCDMAIGSVQSERGDSTSAMIMLNAALDEMRAARETGSNIDSLVAIARKFHPRPISASSENHVQNPVGR